MRGFCLVPGHGASAHNVACPCLVSYRPASLLHLRQELRTHELQVQTNCPINVFGHPRTWMSSRLSSWGLPQLPPLPGTSPYEGSRSAAPSLLPALLASWRLGTAPLLPPPPLAPDAEPVSPPLDSPPSSSCATCRDARVASRWPVIAFAHRCVHYQEAAGLSAHMEKAAHAARFRYAAFTSNSMVMDVQVIM